MPSLLDRLREALAPRYQVERQLGAGGMGVVFLARDQHLDRAVAIKVLRPEQATALAADRFVREARHLAHLSHPNIVPVHDAGEADGLPYYVMDRIEGETLEARLRRGPLPPSEGVKLGRDLLDALEAAHGIGVIHRDIKPSNVFLVGGRALLGDFGIARSTRDDALTLPGAVVGTPGYMPPEQSARGETSARTDLYAVGMVLYEALTGRRWELPVDEAHASWSGVPRALLPVLKRALSWLPEQRWPDATAFRRAWWRTRTRPYVRRTAILAVVGVLVGVAISNFVRPASRRLIRIDRFVQRGGPSQPWLGDSVARYLAQALSGFPDFTAAGPDRLADTGAPHLPLGGVVRVSDDSVCIEVRPAGGAGPAAAGCAAPGDWAALAETLAGAFLREIWRRNLVSDLPQKALPQTAAGFEEWIRAEQLFGQARWSEAYQAYVAAEQIDSTCWLCSLRIHDVQRWLAVPQDPQRTARYLAQVDSFPPHYAALMRANAAPLGARIDTLAAAAERYRFFLAWWVLGDDLFHRGPLVGRSRREGIQAFERAAELRPDFAPAWEHLAMVRITEGDQPGAALALARWRETMPGAPRDPFSVALEALLGTAFVWRFEPPAEAIAALERTLRTPEVAGSEYLAAGARMLLSFDAPEGAVWLGRRFTQSSEHPYLERSGFIAQVLGHVALGQPDSVRRLLDELLARRTEPEMALFAIELAAALLVVDPAPVAAWRSSTERALRRHAAPGALMGPLAERAAGMLALLSEAETGGPALTPAFAALLAAERAARQGDWAEALRHSDGVAADTAAQLADPVLRSVLTLERGRWFAEAGNPEAARRELRRLEHSDVRGLPAGPPQPADVDWGLRTLARWRLATTLDAAGEQDQEVCVAYARVGQFWAKGAPPYRSRADSARARAVALGCGDRR